MTTLDSVQPLPKKGKSIGVAIREAAGRGAANDKPNAQFTVPKMKQVAKLAKSMGQEVTGFTVNADGGFTVITVEPGKSSATAANPWDEVLK